MGPGSGGHTTIFRFISNLERLGFHSRVYLYMSPEFFRIMRPPQIPKRSTSPLLVPEVEVYCDVSQMKLHMQPVATSWTHRLLLRKFPEYDFEVLLRTGFRAAFLCTRFGV